MYLFFKLHVFLLHPAMLTVVQIAASKGQNAEIRAEVGAYNTFRAIEITIRNFDATCDADIRVHKMSERRSELLALQIVFFTPKFSPSCTNRIDAGAAHNRLRKKNLVCNARGSPSQTFRATGLPIE